LLQAPMGDASAGRLLQVPVACCRCRWANAVPIASCTRRWPTAGADGRPRGESARAGPRPETAQPGQDRAHAASLQPGRASRSSSSGGTAPARPGVMGPLCRTSRNRSAERHGAARPGVKHPSAARV